MKPNPTHGIRGVSRAHPPEWKWAAPQNRSWIQWNWERFLRANTALRPGGPQNFRWSAIVCLITHIAERSRSACSRPDCPGCGRDPLLDPLFDHGDVWHTESNGVSVPVAIGHPYIDSSSLKQMAAEVIAGCRRHTTNLAAYVGEAEDDWYNPPSSSGILFQPADAPQVRGWSRVGPKDLLTPPNRPAANQGLRLAVSNTDR